MKPLQMIPDTIYVCRVDGTVVITDSHDHVSGQLDRALDVLAEHCGGYGKVPEKWMDLLGACLRTGKNPEDFARHLVKLSGALRG